uniref:Reverse transcriptase domain-containing protein n=1 Tax=Chromera velia CCMP2878 TaxID=1169474 RepID=A0A0G4HRC9_9ALVE|eukprot:Cvel_30575.t1-p1 / transcript=Cvel_30575.t1 / gene=Cvel_30575 / organism=Chromera_velia_CCMP2878 / gene_product=Retrovirus-related Pol polyprotein from transposon, putative / transcript_product=Retrovirus-related Pol polyprotein from transposon, putative / location=Cvel_scaffold4379:6207-7580(+) / protein_length=458 / sequence_SO=supercontig / SO=protein_coding / is_pseudo=false
MEYTDLFPTARDPGTFKGVEARVEVEPGTTPMSSRPRMVPHAMRAELRKNLQKLLDAGVIAPTSSPGGFSLVLVRKKNGKLRICVDYCRLNNAFKKDRYPLPRLDHTLAKLQGKRWFSSLDLHQGFYQVPVRPSDRDILAFVTADGQYTYLKMPMGISTAPSIFQRSMDIMLAGMGSFVNVYLDDVLVASVNWPEHMQHLRATLNRFRNSGARLSFVKCSWASESLLYLGHIIDTNGLHPNPAKIETILSAPDPKSKKDVKRLIGLASFYHRFIPSFSQVTYPISSLLRKNTPFVWEEPQKQAFAKLKEALTSEPVLHHPDFDRDFLLKPDTSSDTIGAVLTQKDEEGHEHPIAFASRIMTDLEKKWSIMEREALALVYAVDVFKAYLYGRRFTVITDHRSLQHIHTQKDSQPRVMRWSLKLAIYEFEVQHRAGASHLDADAMSRPPIAQLSEAPKPN